MNLPIRNTAWLALALLAAAPEPGAWALLLAGGEALAVRRRVARRGRQGTSLP